MFNKVGQNQINKINQKSYSRNETKSNTNINQDNNISQLQGIPKSYINFKGTTPSIADYQIYDNLQEKLAENALDKNVAGYDETKQKVRKALITPIQRENVLGTTENIPSAVLLYGPIGCGKNLFADNIVKESGAKLVKVHHINPEDFIDYISKEMNKSAEHYENKKNSNNEERNSQEFKNLNPREKADRIIEQKSSRTIFLIDYPEQYLNTYDPEDKNAVKTAKTNTEFMKMIIDDQNKTPFSDKNSGATFLFVTDEPSRIPEEILKTSENIEVPFPTKKDIQEIIKFGIKKGNEEIDTEINKGNTNIRKFDSKKIPYDKLAITLKKKNPYGYICPASINSAINKTTSNIILGYENKEDPTISLTKELFRKNHWLPIKTEEKGIIESEYINHVEKEKNNEQN